MMHTIKKNIFSSCLVWLIISFTQTLFGQEAPSAFSTLKLSLNYVSNINNNQFHQYWHPGQGANFGVQTPFYWGDVQAGLQYVPHKKRTGSPSFESYYVYLGWGYSLHLFRNMHWLNALQAGNYYMDFDDPDINVTQRQESELGIALYSALSLRLYKQLYGYGAVRYLKVFTHKRLELTYLSIGVAFVLETPAWLIEVLK